MRSTRLGLLLLSLSLLAACGHNRIPEERTDDGLVRVPSRAEGGVYRAPNTSYTQYKRVILEPPTIEFVKNWRDRHEDVKDSDVVRIEKEALASFRDEFERELIERGTWTFADAPAPDVLLIVPRIVDLDIRAPYTAESIDKRSYVSGPIQMEIRADLRDAVTNTLVGRVIVFEREDRYGTGEMRLANRVTNSHELRLAFGKWTRMLSEALNVAKAAQPIP